MRSRCTVLKNKIRYGNSYDISDNRWVIAMYTICYSIFAFFVIGFFAYQGKTLIGGLHGVSEVAASMQYNGKFYREVISNIMQGQWKLPMWDMTLGLGGNVLEVVSFQPIYVICSTLFYHHISVGILVYDIVCMYFIGLAFMFYCKHLHCSRWSSLVGALVYVFSGFLLNYCLMQPKMLELCLLLPLLLLGIDRLLEKKKYGLYMVTIGCLALGDSWNLYLMSFIIVSYLIIKYVCSPTNRTLAGFLRYFIRPLISYVVSLLLISIVFIPKMYVLMASGMVEKTVFHADISALYHWSYYLNLLQGITEPLEVGAEGYIAVSGLAVVTIFLLYVQKNISAVNRRLKIEGIALGVILIFPCITYAFNGFTEVSHHWLFIVDFYLSVVIAVMLPYLFHIPVKKKREVCLATLIYIMLYIGVVLWKRASIYLSVVFILVYLLVGVSGKRIRYSVKKAAVYCLVFAEIVTMTYRSFGITQMGRINLFRNSEAVRENLSVESLDILKGIDDSSVYRIAVISENADSEIEEANAGMREGYYAFNGCIKGISKEILDNVKALQLRREYAPYDILSFDERTTLYTLGGVKYIIKYENSEKKQPWGYKLIKEEEIEQAGEKKSIQLWENEHTLPIIYSYDKIVSNSKYEAMKSYEKEEAMLQGLVIDEKDNCGLEEIDIQSDDTVVLNNRDISKQIQEQAFENNAVNFKRGSIQNISGSSTFFLEIPEKYQRSELYLCIKGLHYTPTHPLENKEVANEDVISKYQERIRRENLRQYTLGNPKAVLRVKYGSNIKKSILWGKGSQYDTGAQNVEINLEYKKESADKIKITLSGLGEYQFSNIEVIAHSMKNDTEKYLKLQEYSSEDVTIHGNYITGSLISPQNRMACIAIPYDKGWSAVVNGKEKKIVKANGMYMAVPVEEGYNKIMLHYMMPGLKEGTSVSAITQFICSLFWGIQKYRKRERKKVR